MPNHEKKTVEGEITAVFAHRFVVQTGSNSVLADLGPKLASKANPKIGDKVKVTGEQTPSELKVATFERGDQTFKADEHEGGQKDDNQAPVNPKAALDAVAAKGHKVVAEPHRKPKHFEILGKADDGSHHEHHVGFDGDIRKSKDGDPADKKWKAVASADA